MRRRHYLSFLLLGLFLGASHPKAATEGRGPNPIIRVVTVSQAGLPHEPGHDLLEPTLARLDESSFFQADIVCLPEMFSNRAPEPVLGPVTERLASWARANSSYVIFGLRTKKEHRIYNTAILLDRQGQIIGQYNKIHPTEDEIKEGTTPGADASSPVFKTDFGIIGIQSALM